MFNPSFYPTPEDVARKMWKALGDYDYILDPSAGKGDLLDYSKKKHMHYDSKIRYDAIEINPELSMILKGKGYNVIHDDFFTFEPVRKYNGIVMNPPFDNGDKHLLKAWEILSNGKVVCLLNSETIINPYTARRQLIIKLIEDHGYYERLGKCFINAERRTSVDVCMVVLAKEADSKEFGFFEKFATEKENVSFDVDKSSVSSLTENDTLDSMEYMYKKSLESYREFLSAKNKVFFYTKHLTTGLIREEDLLSFSGSDQYKYNSFVDLLSEHCWRDIFSISNIDKFITKGIRAEFNKFMDGNKRLDFNKRNIKNVINTIGISASNIMFEALLDVFDRLTKYDKKNRIHFEGWKTNDRWRVNKKVIIPNIVGIGWSGEPEFSFYSNREILDDIDRVMCNLTPKKYDKIKKISDALKESFREGWGEEAESEFFYIRYYKKGTIHIRFKDEDLWADFNRAAAKGKKWLPGD